MDVEDPIKFFKWNPTPSPHRDTPMMSPPRILPSPPPVEHHSKKVQPQISKKKKDDNEDQKSKKMRADEVELPTKQTHQQTIDKSSSKNSKDKPIISTEVGEHEESLEDSRKSLKRKTEMNLLDLNRYPSDPEIEVESEEEDEEEVPILKKAKVDLDNTPELQNGTTTTTTIPKDYTAKLKTAISPLKPIVPKKVIGEVPQPKESGVGGKAGFLRKITTKVPQKESKLKKIAKEIKKSKRL